jgi:hypothetical protein
MKILYTWIMISDLVKFIPRMMIRNPTNVWAKLAPKN